MASPRTKIDEFEVSGEQLLSAVKKLVHQGKIRRIAIRNSKGVTLLEIPLVVGLAGAVLVPVWAAVGALAALIARFTLVVEREVDDEAGGREAGGEGEREGDGEGEGGGKGGAESESASAPKAKATRRGPRRPSPRKKS